MSENLDNAAQASVLERKMRLHKRNITGIAAAGKAALEREAEDALFEVELDRALTQWESFQACWDERDILHVLIGDSDTFPDRQWQTHYDELLQETNLARASMISLRRLRERKNVATDVSHLDTTMGTAHAAKIHLPKIPIPQFAGDLLSWTHFKDTFMSLVHNDPNLTKVEKFHYLTGALKGTPAALISRFTINELSYDLAWSKLLEEYDSPRILATFFLERVLDFSVKGIRDEQQRYEAFITGVVDNLEAFRGLKLEEPSEFILSTLALRTLDSKTRKHFELSLPSSHHFPSVDEIITFIRQRMNAVKLSTDIDTTQLERTFKMRQVSNRTPKCPSRSASKYNAMTFHATFADKRHNQFGHGKRLGRPHSSSPDHPSSNRNTSSANRATERECPYCQGRHRLACCFTFASTTHDRRLSFIRGWRGCTNCLRADHKKAECPSKWTCRYCEERHHSLLHSDPTAAENSNDRSRDSSTFVGFGQAPTSSALQESVLLGTVQAYVGGASRSLVPVRALLDSGSQHTFITGRIARQLATRIEPFIGNISGLGGSTMSTPEGSINCTLKSKACNKEYQVRALVVRKVTSCLPSLPVKEFSAKDLSRCGLADPKFHNPGPIDMLIGGDLYPYVVNGAPSASGIGNLFFLPTVFGKVVIGTHDNGASPEGCSLLMQSRSEIDLQLKQFWELEEPLPVDRTNPEDAHCEEHFALTHTRTKDGRYIVHLPFKQDHRPLGNNRETVSRRFFCLERRMNKDKTFLESYRNFMAEYAELGHMSLSTKISPYVIPHHGVWQEKPEGPKLRVVFDASHQSESGSLNDILLRGPKLQADLSNVLTRFRSYNIPLCADLVKMYRQILVHPEHRSFQHIFWRDDLTGSLKEYELNTVTYGLKPSAFLAMRVVRQLIEDEGANFPLAADRVSACMYVDDLVTGASSLDEALELKRQLGALFAKGGFTLGKWASSHPDLMPLGNKHTNVVQINQPELECVKILGLVWDPVDDAFSYTVREPPRQGVTKRQLLSAIAKIFDPLGLLAPVVFMAKNLLQEVWKAQLGWDDELTPKLSESWLALASEWQILANISIPRFVNHSHLCLLVGFCDASTLGYSAAVYLRSESTDGVVTVELIKAKTKVAPVKYTSVARLELCGALLLSRLMYSLDTLNVALSPAVCYTDSEVVLSWLRLPSHQLQVFEANRVSSILSAQSLERWKYVRSEENPADIASRGCLPSKLRNADLWWHGPDWLKSATSSWPCYGEPSTARVCALATTPPRPKEEGEVRDLWMSRFSSFRLLIKSTAYILRLSRRARRGQTPQVLNLTAEEFSNAKQRCLYLVQQTHLTRALLDGHGGNIPSYGKLDAFVDKDGLVRVGGRLSNAPLDYSCKHPILLPRTCHLAKIIVDEIHTRNYHAGATLTLALLRNEFWIPKGMSFVRGRILRCVKCRMHRASPLHPFMAPLPKERFAQFRAFQQVGVDYAGPFAVRESSRKGSATKKAYLCVFVCLSSKASHLEAVPSLTTVSFLAALDRFIARRGVPNTIWSDNTTNFVGASRFMKDFFQFLAQNEDKILGDLSPKGIEWKFIPPRAPHFGGIWEAAVKSAKNLLVSSLGKQPTTFEQLSTAFAKVEGLLNSRPLCALNEDSQNYDFLTPGHFLIGAPLASFPDPPESEISQSLVNKWQTVQAQVARIWRRWRREYLHQLQQRTKWHQRTTGLKVGDLVVLIERRATCGKWPVARVTETYPGMDGVTRVVSVRTPSGSVLTRAASSLVLLLPTENNSEVGEN